MDKNDPRSHTKCTKKANSASCTFVDRFYLPAKGKAQRQIRPLPRLPVVRLLCGNPVKLLKHGLSPQLPSVDRALHARIWLLGGFFWGDAGECRSAGAGRNNPLDRRILCLDRRV